MENIGHGGKEIIERVLPKDAAIKRVAELKAAKVKELDIFPACRLIKHINGCRFGASGRIQHNFIPIIEISSGRRIAVLE